MPVSLAHNEQHIAPHLEAMKQIRAALESFTHPERIVILGGVLGSEVCEPQRSRHEALVLLSYANRVACDRMEQEFTPAPPCMIESATVDINNCCLRCGAGEGEECGEI